MTNSLECRLHDHVLEALIIADQLRLTAVGIALNTALIELGQQGRPPEIEAWPDVEL